MIGDLEEHRLIIYLEYHLHDNHYPPLPVILAYPALEAIRAFEAGDFNKIIDISRVGLVDAVTGESSMTARKIVELFHLEGFIEGEDNG